MESPVRVLIVEDNHDVADAMALLLHHLGGELHVVYEGETAIAEALAFDPALMLIDLGIPGKDGLALAKEIHAMPELSTSLMVAVTGYSDPPHRQMAVDAGFDDYLVKPVAVGRLRELLEQARKHEVLGDGFPVANLELENLIRSAREGAERSKRMRETT